jgi:hypothetical protein
VLDNRIPTPVGPTPDADDVRLMHLRDTALNALGGRAMGSQMIDWIFANVPEFAPLDTPMGRAALEDEIQRVTFDELDRCGDGLEKAWEQLRPIMEPRPDLTAGEAIEILRTSGGKAQ